MSTHPYRRKPDTIALAPKPTPPKTSWWAASYPDARTWYAAAHLAAERLKGQSIANTSDCDTAKFGDAWKKPKGEGVVRFDDDTMVA